MPTSSSLAISEDTGPNLLLNWHEPEETSRHWKALVGTLLFHAVLIPGFVTIARLEPTRIFEEKEITLVRHYTPLIAPRLTQRAVTSKSRPTR